MRDLLLLILVQLVVVIRIEFMALSEIGEDTIVFSDQSDYAANIEKAEVVYQPNEKHDEVKPLTKIETPNVHTAQELTSIP